MKRAAVVALVVIALAGCESPQDAVDACVRSVLELGEARGVEATPELVQQVTETCEQQQKEDPEGFQETWG